MSEHIEKQFTIPNELGLHARAASKLVKVSNMFQSSVKVCSDDGRSANGKSVIDLLTLGAEQGHNVVVVVDGSDADEAMTTITDLFANNLGD